EGNIDDRETSRLGVVAFTDIATALGSRIREAGAIGDEASISALMALLERFAYFLVSRELEFDAAELLDTVTRVVPRRVFATPPAAYVFPPPPFRFRRPPPGTGSRGRSPWSRPATGSRTGR